MFQYIFEQCCDNNRFRSRFFNFIRNRIIKYYDPIVAYNLNGKQVFLNLSHLLPYYRKSIPTYSANLTRLSSYIRNRSGRLCMIDIGANVGDSYFLTCPEPNDEYLLIEGDAHYFDLLVRNTKYNQQVSRVFSLLSNKVSIFDGTLQSEGGTARIIQDDTKQSKGSQYSTLDKIVEANPRFQNSNLIKTDVDGYDSRVLMGGLAHIIAAAPVLFFEHHPRLLRMVGEDDTSIFSQLARVGYNYFTFYDNAGFLLTTVKSDNTQQILDLIFYAKQKDGYYYDICCFNDRDTVMRDEFLNKETNFFMQM